MQITVSRLVSNYNFTPRPLTVHRRSLLASDRFCLTRPLGLFYDFSGKTEFQRTPCPPLYDA